MAPPENQQSGALTSEPKMGKAKVFGLLSRPVGTHQRHARQSRFFLPSAPQKRLELNGDSLGKGSKKSSGFSRTGIGLVKKKGDAAPCGNCQNRHGVKAAKPQNGIEVIGVEKFSCFPNGPVESLSPIDQLSSAIAIEGGESISQWSKAARSKKGLFSRPAPAKQMVIPRSFKRWATFCAGKR